MKDTSVQIKSSRLLAKRIAFGVCGGIGAIEVVKMIRELRRHGAEVTAFLTPDVKRFITPLSIQWACNRAVVEEPSWEVEHLENFDAVVVAPATLNTLQKAATGLADNAVTLLIAHQISLRLPIFFFPAMNLALRKHPLFNETKEKLESWGAKLFEEPSEEDKIKMPSRERMAALIIEGLGGGD